VFEHSFRKVLKEYWSSTNETLEEKPLSHLLEQGFVQAGVEADGLHLDEIGRVFYRPIQEQITEYPDTLDVLRRLREKNLLLAVVSNSIFPREYHLEELSGFGLAPFFHFIVFSSDVGRRKPHPEIFNTVLRELALSPAEVIFVGDRMREDVQGPQNLGMRAILRYHPRRDYSLGAAPMAQVRSLAEMLPIIEKQL
jgi:putative hydrolase of the HAD superfamily